MYIYEIIYTQILTFLLCFRLQKVQQHYWLDGGHLSFPNPRSQSTVFVTVPVELGVSPGFLHLKKNLPINIDVLQSKLRSCSAKSRIMIIKEATNNVTSTMTTGTP